MVDVTPITPGLHHGLGKVKWTRKKLTFPSQQLVALENEIALVQRKPRGRRLNRWSFTFADRVSLGSLCFKVCRWRRSHIPSRYTGGPPGEGTCFRLRARKRGKSVQCLLFDSSMCFA